MDLNAIMSNIYGENSSQSFDSLGFSGGHIPTHRANIKYLDETKPDPSSSDESINSVAIASSYRASKIFNAYPDITLTGGATSIDHIYPSAEYVDNSDLQTFIKEFYLHYLVTNAHKNMILIVPTSSTLKKLVSDFKAALKKEGIDAYTAEASKFAAKSDQDFKNYIFDVFGRSSNNNEGFPYQVDDKFPSKPLTEIFRRTNRASRQYFFKFTSASKIEVSDNEKMTGASTLKLIGKCDRAVFILQGDVPASSGGKGSKVVKASLAGGVRSNPLQHEFIKCIKRNHDLDTGAYEFIARVSKASGAQAVAPFYSGDYVHTAFSIIAGGDNLSVDRASDEFDLEEQHNKIIDNYKPVKNIVKMDKVAVVLPKLYRDSINHAANGSEANQIFISNLRKMYSAIKSPKYMLAADVATALTKNNDNLESVRNALNIMEELDKTEKSEGSMTGGFIRKSTSLRQTPLINSVYSALSSSPFIGSIAREYTPILMTPTTLKRSAFEDHNNELLEENDDDLNEDDGASLEDIASNGNDGNCPACKDCGCGDGDGTKSANSTKKQKKIAKNEDIAPAEFDIKSFF